MESRYVQAVDQKRAVLHLSFLFKVVFVPCWLCIQRIVPYLVFSFQDLNTFKIGVGFDLSAESKQVK